MTETIRSKKPKLFVVWPFTEKFASVYSQGCHLLYKQNKTRKLSGKQRAHLLQLQQQTQQTVRTVKLIPLVKNTPHSHNLESRREGHWLGNVHITSLLFPRPCPTVTFAINVPCIHESDLPMQNMHSQFKPGAYIPQAFLCLPPPATSVAQKFLLL